MMHTWATRDRHAPIARREKAAKQRRGGMQEPDVFGSVVRHPSTSGARPQSAPSDVQRSCRRTSLRLGDAEFMKTGQGKTFYVAKTHSSPSWKTPTAGQRRPASLRVAGRWNWWTKTF